jgi:LysM repeat protein
VTAALDIPDPAIEIYGSSARSGSRTHVVRRGETLGGIAKKYGTTTSALMRLNGLKKAVIHPGQELAVRAAARRTTSSKAASTKSTTKGRTSSKPRTGAKTVAKK